MPNKKLYSLSEKAIDIVEQVKITEGYSNASVALEHIIRAYIEKRPQEKLQEIVTEYKSTVEKIRISSNIADRNIQILMEVLNTIIQYSFPKDVLQPIDSGKAIMLSQAEEIVKKRIARNKQIADEKKRKQRGKRVPTLAP